MKIGFIGLGNMAQAMIGGVLRNHLAVPEEIYGSAKTAETESKVHEMFGITVTGDNLETARQAELLILAVKPQFLEKVIGQISDIDLTGKTILSIAAGKSLAWLEEQFCAPLPFVRAMPNTPALVGEGMSCIAASEAVPEADLAETETLLSAVGLCRRVSEKQLDAVTGLSGSGPAFVLEFIQALADGGVYAGLPRATAIELAVQTVLGSAKMARDAKTPIGELRDAVISPAGTTSRGVMELAKGAFSATVAQAVAAAADRSAELGALSAEK